MVDMAHFAGLVAAGLHPNPVPYADVVTTTTHKTLGGPRGGVILSQGASTPRRSTRAVFPGQQGGPLEHVIAAKAVAFKLAASPEFKERQERTLRGRQASSPNGSCRDDVAAAGITVVNGGTDVHLVLVDLRNSELDGQQAEDRAAPHRHHRQPQRRPVRPPPADGLLRPADRHPGPGHPRLRRRRSSPKSRTSSPTALIAGASGTLGDEHRRRTPRPRHRPRRAVPPLPPSLRRTDDRRLEADMIGAAQ